MANFSKRPIFKSKAEIYKKSKWQKFKEYISLLFSNIKRWFAKVFYRINEKGSQRLTIMVVPHTEKRIINIQISNYIMFFFMVILTVTVITSIIAIANNQQTHKQYVFLKQEEELKRQQIEDFKKKIESFDKRFTSLKVDVNNIIRSVGKDKNIYDYNNIEVLNEYSNNTATSEAKILNKLKLDLEITKDNIIRIGNCIEEWKNLLNSIPSKYPLPFKAQISSRYGWRVDPVYKWKMEHHPGLDLCILPGTSVLAAADGEVSLAGWHGGYGFMVEIKHKYGFSTRYAHMMDFAPGIAVGAKVRQGQVIGYVGTTGKSTGYHLHFEVRIGDKTVDPMPFTSMMLP